MKINRQAYQREYNKIWQEENKEYRRKYMRKYLKEWRKKNRGQIKEYQKEYCIEWRKKNMVKGTRFYEKKLFLNLRRLARKKNAEGSHTFEEWQELKKRFDNRCVCCWKQEPEIALTQDHVTPLSKQGTDYISNIQPLCRSCNSIKKDKIIAYV